MKLKIAALTCALLAVVLTVVTLIAQGEPLGYRGRPAVIREVVGSVELRVAGGRPEPARHATLMEWGTEIRTSIYASAQLDTPEGRIQIFDSTVLRTRKLEARGQATFKLDAGRLQVAVDSAGGMVISPQASTARVELLPGSYELIADGRGLLAGFCIDGTALLHEGDGRPTEVQAGKVFIITPLAPAVVTAKPPPLDLQASVTPRSRAGELATISGRVTPGGRLYINGEPLYPDSAGEFVSAVAPGTEQVVIVAEDVTGHAERKVLSVPN